jgi:hypothetical protein
LPISEQSAFINRDSTAESSIAVQQLNTGDTIIANSVDSDELLFRFSDTDSALNAINEAVINADTVKLFKGHQLHPVHTAPLPVMRKTPDWFTLALVIVVIAFAWIRAFYFKIFRQIVSAFFSNSISNQIVRDENILVQRASVLMSFIFYLTSALFLYQVSIYFNWQYRFIGEGFLRFLVACLIIAFAYSIKMVMLKGLGEVFKLDKPVATYIFNIFLINNILGVLLIPVVISIAYVVTLSSGIMIYTGIVIVIIAFIYRLVRAFSIWMTLQGVSLFYLILYFCTLEIAPLVIIIKLARG